MNPPLVAAMLLVAIGLLGLVQNRNLIKLIMSLTVLEAGINLFLVGLAYRGQIPIFTQNEGVAASEMALPTLQALTLTSIVIGVSVTAMLLAFAVVTYRYYGTLDTEKIRRLRV